MGYKVLQLKDQRKRFTNVHPCFLTKVGTLIYLEYLSEICLQNGGISVLNLNSKFSVSLVVLKQPNTDMLSNNDSHVIEVFD